MCIREILHPAYGSIRDFRLLLREARRRGLRIITELVLNHTSDQHPWFQRARLAKPGTSHRDFYVWSDTPDRYRDARIIFKDFESSNWTWDPVAGAYYWHRFYAHQPDLNFDNPEVRRAMFDAVDFWLDMGVDGLRLDAVPYLFEREGTNCENLPETYVFLEELRAHVDGRYGTRLLLAEANQWPEDAAAYFGTGNRCHMAFHFPLMPRMFMSIRMEDRFPVVDILSQTPSIPDTAQWALFLRNHDELTLEMVTDEERDYMYRVYAEDPQARINLGIRRRLAPLLGNDRRLIEMTNGLLFSLPGTPVLYYGDEIGMGDNIYLGDRNGVRTPMQWSADRNAGFSAANPQRLYLPVIIDPEYHASAINVEAQQNNPHSLLWFMKRLIGLRKRYKAFGRGTIEFLYPENRKVLTFFRTYEDERILVVANLSRQAQYVELDLSKYEGMIPVELFGRTEFPRIGELPYFLTLGPHAFYWFSLEPQRVEELSRPGRTAPVPVLAIDADWETLFAGPGRGPIEELLPSYLVGRRWFRSKARRIKSVEIVDWVPIPGPPTEQRPPETVGVLSLVHVDFVEGDPELYALPLALAPVEPGSPDSHLPWSAIARLRGPTGERVLHDGVWDASVSKAIFECVARRRRLNGVAGQLLAAPTLAFRKVRGPLDGRALEPTPVTAEQTNTSVVFGDRMLLKLFRKLEEGENPDIEVGRLLTDDGGMAKVPPMAGWLEYQGAGAARRMAVGILQGFVPNEGDAWRYTLDSVDSYLEEALTRHPEDHEPPLVRGAQLLELAEMEPPPLASDMIGPYLESARLLGRRTAELHLALSARYDRPEFAPEPFTPHYQRSLYQSSRSLVSRTYRFIRANVDRMPQLVQIADLEPQILERLGSILATRIEAERTRIHGDYHLGQVLYTGRDFVIIDFEGEPDRPLSERRIKRSPLRDVAGMLRSFHYAAYTGLFGEPAGGMRPENPSFLEPWVLQWYQWVSAAFLRSYFDTAASASFLPRRRVELEVLLDVLLLDKALYELRYEINNRPEWIALPIEGLLHVLEAGA
jgi:maltose alpha-D-glucosyltransferase/alpha-amylase